MILIKIALVLFVVNLLIFLIKFFPKITEKTDEKRDKSTIWIPETTETIEKFENREIKIDYTEEIEVEYSENQENKQIETKDKIIKIKNYNTDIQLDNRLI